jgi:hypothetical protein
MTISVVGQVEAYGFQFSEKTKPSEEKKLSGVGA